MSYFEDKSFSEEDRRQVAFATTKAVRESVSLARRAPNPITYESALDLIHDLDEKVYYDVTNLLKGKNESDTVKFYKEKAEALSTTDDIVSPIHLIDTDIVEIEPLIQLGDKKRFLKKKLFDLKAARDYFAPREVSEHRILYNDFFLAERPQLFNPKMTYENDSYKDYKLDGDRILRMRLLHPDKPEAILGADLIYEQFDLLTQKVRFVHLQYKMWEDEAIYFSKGSVSTQISKLQNNICDSGYCNDEQGNSSANGFRLPHCAAFFRPTSKLSNADSKLVSTGIHVPICNIKEIMSGSKAATKRNTKGKCVSYKIFEELFVSDLLGSRWMTLDQLDNFYRTHDMLSYTDSIRVHAQEIILATEEEIDLREKALL